MKDFAQVGAVGVLGIKNAEVGISALVRPVERSSTAPSVKPRGEGFDLEPSSLRWTFPHQNAKLFPRGAVPKW